MIFMLLFEQVYQDMIKALKEKREGDKVILSLVYGYLKDKAKELKVDKLDDANSIQIIKREIKKLEEEKELFTKLKRDNNVKTIEHNLELLKGYLPEQLGENKIKILIEALDDKSIPSIMKFFKANYNGQVDMGLVSKIAKEFQ